MLRTIFIPYLILEFILAYFFANAYGILALLFEVFASSMLGIFFILQGGITNFRSNLSQNSFENFVDFYKILGMAFGGLLLFLPGLFSDILGIIILIFSLFKKGENTNYKRQNDYESEEVIDVEVIDDNTNTR
ncbi:MAG: FxsA family protein [Campylobacter sp.]|nr:FxsA family protein [Campylobacter sp.]